MIVRRRAAGLIAALLSIAACGGTASPMPTSTSEPSPGGPTATPTAAASTPAPTLAVDMTLFEAAPAVDVDAASTQFDDPAELDAWRVSQGEAMDGGTTTFEIVDGYLRVDAAQSEWIDRSHGWSAGRTIAGDIVVTLSVNARGRDTELPTVPWSLAGVMLRTPTTDPTQENWIHWSAGMVGESTLERKETRGGRSELVLIRVPAYPVELRVLRHGASVVLFHRVQLDGEPWTLDHVYVRPDLPPELELLLTTQTGGESDHGDLVAAFERLDVAPSPITGELAEMLSAGRAVDPQQLIDALGG